MKTRNEIKQAHSYVVFFFFLHCLSFLFALGQETDLWANKPRALVSNPDSAVACVSD